MRTLITGATGFIGGALCREMLLAGHEVTAVVRPGSPKRAKLPAGIAVVELDLHGLAELQGGYDVFYHLAWNGSSGDARDDFNIQQTNIGYTVDAVRAAKRCGCRRFVGAGSQAEYGVVKGICTEETAPDPFTFYGAAKLAAYHMGKILAGGLGLSFVWPRIYSVYGVGENYTVISYVMDALLKGEEPALTTCENYWDFLYISDCTAALRLLGEHEDAGGIYNVSFGSPRRLREFIEIVRNVVELPGKLHFGARPSNPLRTFWLEPNTSRLRDIGFEPGIAFVAGIKMKLEELLGGL